MVATAPLFSSYQTRENQVTGAFMAVLQRLQLPFAERLLTVFTQDAERRLMSFALQTTDSSDSVPDGEIRSGVRWLLEVKVVRDSVDVGQLRRHLAQLDGRYPDELLLVLTPDPARPPAIDALDDVRLVWSSFARLADEIRSLLADGDASRSERDDFLLRELLALLRDQGLLDHDDTVVVAARNAWPEYAAIEAYICQPNRSFRTGLTHLGFYADGEIKPLVPEILASHPAVHFTEASAHEWEKRPDGAAIAALIRKTLTRGDGRRVAGESYGVFILTSPTDPRTKHMRAAIRNTTTAKSGRPWAWTLGQRYTRIEHLLGGHTTTTQLDGATTA